MWIGQWWAYLLCFLLMGRAQAAFASLSHEAAHRLLFSKKKVNDWVGRWVVGYPAFISTDLYRRGHMAHHRDEFGPDEPDMNLYRGYPISPASLRRKLTRDLFGNSRGGRTSRACSGASRTTPPAPTPSAILACQVVIFGVFAALGYWWLYWVLWFLPWMTLWRVINRLRAIAEHGGMERSKDRRRTTHSVRQHLAARFFMVPYNIGWHLAHHVDMGVPWKHLPAYHAEPWPAAGSPRASSTATTLRCGASSAPVPTWCARPPSRPSWPRSSSSPRPAAVAGTGSAGAQLAGSAGPSS